MISKSNLIKQKLKYHLSDYISVINDVGLHKFLNTVFKEELLKEKEKKVIKNSQLIRNKSINENPSNINKSFDYNLIDNTYWNNCFNDLSKKEECFVKIGYILKYNKYILKDIYNKNINALEEFQNYISSYLNSQSLSYYEFNEFINYYKNYGRILPIDEYLCQKVLSPIFIKVKSDLKFIEDPKKFEELIDGISKIFNFVEAFYYNGKIKEVFKIIDVKSLEQLLNIFKEVLKVETKYSITNFYSNFTLMDFILQQGKNTSSMCEMNFFSDLEVSDNDKIINENISSINKSSFYKLDRVISVFKEMNLEYIPEFKFDKYKVDFYLPKYNSVVEINGYSHYYPLQTQLKQKDKFRYCFLRRMYGLNFVFIQKFYDEYYVGDEQYNEYVRKSLLLVLNKKNEEEQLDKKLRKDVKYDIIEGHNKAYFDENYFFQNIKL